MTFQKSDFNPFSDTSTVFLLLSNLITLILALVQHWNVITVLIIYVIQSIIIGFFTFIKILTWNPGPKGWVEAKGKVVILPKIFGRIANLFLAGFFALHYGTFQAVYLFFLVGFGFMTKMPLSEFPAILIASMAFFIAHLVSYIMHRKEQESIAHLMGYPYLRIIPMHFTIILGGAFMMFSQAAAPFILAFFIILKTLVDVIFHKKQHEGQKRQ